MQRIEKENYYLDIAETVLERSTCLRRQYGAIIVRNDEIVATGYNGAPRGAESGTSSAGVSTLRPTRSSPRPATNASERICTWWDTTRCREKFYPTRRPARCAGA